MNDLIRHENKILTDKERNQLERHNTRIVSEFQAKKLEIDAKKHWDLFYKRNEDRFFKDRHWTTREFHELLDTELTHTPTLFEIGCGAGNLIYPLLEENPNLRVYACDFSPRAVQLVKDHKSYDPDKIHVFDADITTNDVFKHLKESSVDIVTLIFVLSAIHPEKFDVVFNNIHRILKPGGILLFRDYGLHDMAQLRFKPGHKIMDNFYMRQDGTRSYYFSLDEIGRLSESYFHLVSNCYVERKTINFKEGMDVPRLFIQSKFKKMS